MFGPSVSGKVQVLRQGLYYRVICHCRISGDVVCRLMVKTRDRQENLGVVVPEGDGFCLDKRISIKRMGEGKPEFFLLPKHEKREGTFVPIYPEEPFGYIERLKDSFLAQKNGQTGILLP